MKAVSDRLGHLVRPLDVVTYFDTGIFALILNQPTIEHCTAACYQRIYDGLRLRSFSTRAGFLDAEALITGDKYIFIRDAYLQRRDFLIKDGEIDDEFAESLDEDEDF